MKQKPGIYDDKGRWIAPLAGNEPSPAPKPEPLSCPCWICRQVAAKQAA